MSNSLLILGNGAPDGNAPDLIAAPAGSVYIDSTNLPNGSGEKSLEWGASLRGDAATTSQTIGGISFSSVISDNGTPETQIQGIFDNTIADYTKPKPSNWPDGSPYPPTDTWQGAFFGNIPSFQPSNPGANACFIFVVNQSMQGNGQESGLAKVSIRKCDPALMGGDDTSQKRALETSQNLGYLPNSYSIQQIEVDTVDSNGKAVPASPDVIGYSAIIRDRAYPGKVAMRLPTNSLGGLLDGTEAKYPSNSGADDGVEGWALPEFMRLRLDTSGKMSQAQISLNRTITGNPNNYPIDWVNLAISDAPFETSANIILSSASSRYVINGKVDTGITPVAHDDPNCISGTDELQIDNYGSGNYGSRQFWAFASDGSVWMADQRANVMENKRKVLPISSSGPIKIEICLDDVAPDGYLFLRGQTFNPATYPVLAKKFPNNTLPDFQNRVPRGVGDLIALGEMQEDASQRITGYMAVSFLSTVPPSYPRKVSGAFTNEELSNLGTFTLSNGGGILAETISFDNSKSDNARTADETRVKAVGLNFIIKAQ